MAAVQVTRYCSAEWAVAFLLLVSAAAVTVVQAADHTVGGATNGWKKPNGNTLTDTYLQDWAKGESFTQGDRLRKYWRRPVHGLYLLIP